MRTKSVTLSWAPLCFFGVGSVLGQNTQFRSPAQFDPPPAVQKVTTAESDLAAPGTQPHRPDSPFSWRGITLRPHLDFSVTYGNGLRAGPGAGTKTVTETISPGLAIDLGPQWTLDYTPRLNYYSSKAFKDTLAHNASLHGRATWEDWKFGFSQTYSLTEDPLIETASQTEQEIYGTSLTASHPIGSKFLLELGAYQYFRFTPTLNDSRSWSTMDWLNYQIAQRLSVAGGLGIGYDDVSAGSDMLNEQIQGRVNMRIAEKLNLAVNGGVEIRQFQGVDADDLVNPIYGASIQYRPLVQTTLTLSGNRRVAPSFFAGQIAESTDISIALHQRLLEVLQLTLSGGFGTTDYLFSFGNLTQSRSDDTTSFLASLGYHFLKRANASVFYQVVDHSSTLPGFDYTTSMVGLNLSYRY